MDGTQNTIPVQTVESTAFPAEKNALSFDFEQTKTCYLHLSRLFCPELPPDCADLNRLKALQGRIDQARKLCLLLNRPWLENNHLIQKACDWYMTDQRIYYRERQRMIDVAMDRNLFLERVIPFAGCIRRMKSFFVRQSGELETVIRTLEHRR